MFYKQELPLVLLEDDCGLVVVAIRLGRRRYDICVKLWVH